MIEKNKSDETIFLEIKLSNYFMKNNKLINKYIFYYKTMSLYLILSKNLNDNLSFK